MDKGQEFAEDFIAHNAHYSSKYYDPVKAKEYYERTKELKGRKPAVKELGKNQGKKDTWRAVNAQIGEAKRGDIRQVSETRKQELEKVRQNISEWRKKLSQQLSEKLKELSSNQSKRAKEIIEQSKAEAEKITKQTEARIKALPPIPNGLTKAQLAAANSERAAEIAKIRGESNAERAKLTESTNKDRNVNRFFTGLARGDVYKTAKSDREVVQNEMKAAVEETRQKFKTRIEQLKAQYEEETLAEFEKVKSNA